ncbi:MAG: EAL domain-containing protein [Gammaproteobacteria bacterium]|nr:EAL domain-containing protein [Gammaproteobacteria bacterium]
MTEDKSPSQLLRTLILDDSPDDAEQASQALRQTGYVLKTQRLETGIALDQTLESGAWDLILCAHGVPNLQPRQVVELVAHKKLAIPVIVLARRIQDAEFLALIESGVRDVVMKGQWARLPPAVKRELATVEERRHWAETHDALLQLEGRYRAMIEASLDPISYVQDGMHMDANPAYLRLFGYEDIEQLKENPLLNLFDKADQPRLKAALRKPESANKLEEFQAVGPDGQRFAAQVAMTPLTINGEPCLQIVVTDISKRKALETKLQSMRQHDALTGLYNRTHFLESLSEGLKSPNGVFLGINIDNLPALNQALGRMGCDALLVQVAKALREIAGSSTLARIGGGQFCILLDGKAAPGAEGLAGKIRTALAALRSGESMPPEGIGASVRHMALDSGKSATANLDELFKGMGPSVAVAATPVAAPAPVRPEPASTARTPTPVAETPSPAAAPVMASQDMREALQQAVAKGGLELLFQPIINLHGDPHCYYEAQLMLRAGDNRLIPANDYMAAAEAAGLGGKIDRNLMLNVIDLLSKHHLEGRQGAVFARLSATSVQDSALLAAVEMHLKATGIGPENIILQIDEAALARHTVPARAFIKKARQAGLRLALDNFSGRALSVESLADIEIDFIAVNCGPSGPPEDMRFGAIDEARALDQIVIARGIEDADVFSSLFSRGVHYVQGDYLQPASTGLDYSFESEQTLTSETPPGPGWASV